MDTNILSLGIGLLATATSFAPLSVPVSSVPSSYPVAVSCTIVTSDSASGTSNYYADFSAKYTNKGARAIGALSVQFVLMQSGRPVATRTVLDSGGLPANGAGQGSWRVVGLPSNIDGASCTIAAVRYQ